MSVPLSITDASGAVALNAEAGVLGLVHSYRRRVPVFFAVLGAMVLAALVFTWAQTPRYSAVATLMIAPTRVEVGSGAAGPADIISDAAVDSQVELLKSGLLAQAVVDRLDLSHDGVFAAALNPPSRLGFSAGKAPRPPPLSRSDAVVAVEKSLTVRRVAQTLVMEVTFTSSDAPLAARIANAYVDAYVSQSLGLKLTDSRTANGLLGSQLVSLRAQVEAAETAVAQYKREHNLLSVEGSTMAEQEISALDQQVATQRASAAEADARLSTARQQMAKGSHGDDVGEALGSPVIQDLRKQRAVATQKLADLRVRFGPRYPEVMAAQEQVVDIDSQIASEIKRVISNLDAQNQVASRRVGSIEGSLGRARGSLNSGSSAFVKLNELQRTADSVSALYQGVLNRVKETQTQEATARPDARVANYAPVPDRASSPKLLINLLIGLLLGAGAGIGAVIVSKEMDTGLSTMEDVEGRLRLPYFGALPTASSVIRGNRARSAPDAMSQNRGSSLAEAFKGLAVALAHSGSERSSSIIAVTSALPKEGKTTAAICLARMLAMMQLRVVLVDCDIRRPTVATALRLSPKVGLIDVLDGKAELADTLVMDDKSSLAVVPLTGGVLSNGSPFASPNMDKVLEQLRADYDIILLDTPPVLPAIDSRVLCQKADAVVLLVRWRKTPEKAVRLAASLLSNLGVRIEGVALSRVDMKAQARSGYGDPGFYGPKFAGYYTT